MRAVGFYESVYAEFRFRNNRSVNGKLTTARGHRSSAGYRVPQVGISPIHTPCTLRPEIPKAL
jgi:hypothetical protein